MVIVTRMLGRVVLLAGVSRSLTQLVDPATLVAQTKAEFMLPGTWLGIIGGSDFVSVRISVRSAVNGLEGTLDFPNNSTAGSRQLRNIKSTGPQVHFEWNEGDSLTVVDGRRQGNTIEGAFRRGPGGGSDSGSVFLRRGVTLAGAAAERFYGLYQVEPGHLVWMGPVSEMSRRFGFIDPHTGRTGVLYPTSVNSFVSGTTAFVPFPSDISASFPFADSSSGGDVIWQQDTGRVIRAVRMDAYRTEAVAFRNDTVNLVGTLVMPKGPGRHPAVVFIHGSGGATRAYFSSLPYLLANAGVAGLIYDKRGSGGSTGDRRAATMENLADDALAGVRLLASRPDIDPRQIGVYGHSQGGWQAPLAAVRSAGAVAFVIMVSGPAKSFELQTNDEVANNMRAAGFSDADVREALAHHKLYWQVVRNQAPWSALEESTRRVAQRPWGRFVWQRKTEAEVREGEVKKKDYDPGPVLAKLTVPTLAVYGENDLSVNGAENAKILEKALEGAGNKDFEVRLFPDADHDIWFATTKGNRGYREVRGYREGYLEGVVGWVVKHVPIR